MTTTRPTPLDDHGGPVPAPASQDRLVRMHAAYVHKVNAVVGAGHDDLAHELARSFDEEMAGGTRSHHDRRSAGRRTPSRAQGAPGPGRVGRFTRRSLKRFDRYTLDVFNAGTPQRTRDDRSA